jgi:hypothetical protein
VEIDIKVAGKDGEQGKTERKRMMEILQEFEKTAAEEEEALMNPDEDDDELMKALEGIDLGQIPLNTCNASDLRREQTTTK